jgi:hypothetical protein
MAGMETQIAVAVMLGNVYFLLKQRWYLLGIFSGLGLLTRPEFVFWVGGLSVFILMRHRKRAMEVLAPLICVVAPWGIFAWSYYGSIVPHTIEAKTWSGRIGLFTAPLERMWDYVLASWRHIAPFKQWVFAYAAPLPDATLLAVVAVVLALASYSVGRAVVDRDWSVLLIAAVLLSFLVYRCAAVINPYFMWYLPPFAALLFALTAKGVNALSGFSKALGGALACVIGLAYAMHPPFTFPVDKLVQHSIEVGVRKRVGQVLNKSMGDSDSVVLEPLGYIGYEAFNKTTYDFPGLSSKKVTRAIRKLPEVRMGGLIGELKPSHVVLRPAELAEFAEFFPDVASDYAPVAHIKADPHPRLERWGYRCYVVDDEFWILQRIPSPM